MNKFWKTKSSPRAAAKPKLFARPVEKKVPPCEPMPSDRRVEIYLRSHGTLTPTQARRLNHKRNRAMRATQPPQRRPRRRPARGSWWEGVAQR